MLHRHTAISAVFYRDINSLNRAAGNVCRAVFLLDKKRGVMTADTSSTLSHSVPAGKLDKTNKTAQCDAELRELIRTLQCGRKPHGCFQHVVRGC